MRLRGFVRNILGTELVGDQNDDSTVEILGGLEVFRIERLKIGEDNLVPGLGGVTQAAGKQRRLAYLPRALDQHHAVMTQNGLGEKVVGGAHDVKLRVERDSAATGFER